MNNQIRLTGRIMRDLVEIDPKAYQAIALKNGVTCLGLKKLIEEGTATIDALKNGGAK